MSPLRAAAALLIIIVPGVVAACGGEEAPADPVDPTPAVSDIDGEVNEQPVAPDRPIPTPTPLPADFPILQVVAGGTGLTPTRDEFLAIPTTTITADGREFTGVTLAELARRVTAPEGAVVTIHGTRADNLRFGVIRYPLSDVAEQTVLVLDDSGYVSLASSAIPPEKWLHTLTGIAFQ
jgi:hypothetical protein